MAGSVSNKISTGQTDSSDNNIAKQLETAARIVKSGGVIAYPTEGVWGLGCDPRNLSAVKRILAIKSRPEEKGLILIASHINQLLPFLGPLPKTNLDKLVSAEERPITWVCPASEGFSWLTGGRNSLAVRISDHPIVQELCNSCGGALVSTSANISGDNAAKTREEVESTFSKSIDMICPGETGGQVGASEIRDLRTGKVLRPAGT